jgi:hypothetical protein
MHNRSVPIISELWRCVMARPIGLAPLPSNQWQVAQMRACTNRSTIRARMMAHGRTGRQCPHTRGPMPSLARPSTPRLGSQYISGWPSKLRADACAPVTTRTRPGECSLPRGHATSVRSHYSRQYYSWPTAVMNFSRCHSTQRSSLEPETAVKSASRAKILAHHRSLRDCFCSASGCSSRC